MNDAAPVALSGVDALGFRFFGFLCELHRFHHQIFSGGLMSTRWFVYDIDTTMEDFVASFASVDDAIDFGIAKFGDRRYITHVALHEKVANRGRAKKRSR